MPSRRGSWRSDSFEIAIGRHYLTASDSASSTSTRRTPGPRAGGVSSTFASDTRKGARWRPTIFPGGHHSRLARDGRGFSAPAFDLGALVRGDCPREEEAAEAGARVDPSAGAGRDRLRHSIRLLRREPALLDGKGGDVSRRVDVGEATNLPEAIRGDEALRVLGKLGEPLPFEPGKRNDALGADTA